ncbi:MAG TPA: hypothetical protein VFW33_10750 [Gemmataceae bacterium]|nr:hypothetical protein [Gemmataceae bacterium]
MAHEFSFVDWRIRFCEHLVLVIYGRDEESLIVAGGITAPRFGY